MRVSIDDGEQMREAEVETLTSEQLRSRLEYHFPRDAACWSQATDEVRDLCRWAREHLELGEDEAIDFRVLKTPAAWNSVGIDGLIAFYDRMTPEQKAGFTVTAVECFPSVFWPYIKLK